MERKIIKECPKHGLSEHVLQTNNTYKCVECRKQAVNWKRRCNKLRLIEYKGGKCEICGYNKCIEALEFHHKNPNDKEFGISNGNTVSFEKMKVEADKCMLVCSNCHREIHAKIKNEQLILEEEEIEKRRKEFYLRHPLKSIKKERKQEKKNIKRNNKKINITLTELIELFKTYRSFLGVGRFLNVTDNAVRKFCKKMGLPTHTKELLNYING